uniref:Uncharacterized protein n=1 Tax=Salmo trutta TaxID=8032 RepID=A0A673ZBK0_SALTR
MDGSAAGTLSSNTHYPNISSITMDTANTVGQDWLCTQSSSSSASPEDFPSVPQGLVPPSLESLSCTSLNSGQDLLGKAVQGKVCTLVQIVLLRASPPNIFQLQLRPNGLREGPNLCCPLLQRCSWDSKQGLLRDPGEQCRMGKQ